MREPTVPAGKEGPYVGPNPLEFSDPIFGRDVEIASLLEQLIADRIVLLHSPTGCGKSSLIEAGLRHKLFELRFFALPTILAGRPDLAGAGHPANPLLRGVFDCLEKPQVDSEIKLAWPARSAGMHLTEFLDRRDPEPAEIEDHTYQLLIFDQFEEVLTARCQETDRIAFFKEVAGALQNRARWALFSMREDYLGPLEPYLKYLPTQLSSRFRLKGLSVANACLAIREPAKPFGVDFQADAALRLAQYLAGVRASENDGGDASSDANEVEPVQLQVVCDHIWRQERKEPARITKDDLQLREGEPGKANTVDEALGEYYRTRIQEIADSDEELQRQLREWFDRELITPEGYRRPVALGAVPFAAETIQQLINRYLIRKDVRGSAVWLELTHDRLVPAVRRENREWLRRHLQTWQVRARQWHDCGRQKYLLIGGEDLAAAQEWSRAHPERVREGTLDWDFLRASELDERMLASVRRWRVHAVCTIAVLALIAVLSFVGMRRSWQHFRQFRREQASLFEKVKSAENSLVTATRDMKVALDAKTKAEKEMDTLSAQLEDWRVMVAASVEERNRLGAKIDGLNRAKEHLETEGARLAAAKEAAETAASGADQRRVSAEAAAQRESARAQRMLSDANAAQQEADKVKQYRDALDLDLRAAQAPGQTGIDLAARAIEILPGDAGTQDVSRAAAALGDALARSLESHTDRIDFSGELNTVSVGSANSGGCIMAVNSLGRVLAYRVGDETSDCANLERLTEIDWAKAGDFSAAGAAIGLATGEVVLVKPSQDEVERFQPHRYPIVSLALSADGRYLAVSNSVWTFSVWDLEHERKGVVSRKRIYRAPGILSRITGALRGGTTELVNSVAIFRPPGAPSGAEGYVAVAAEDGSVAVHRLGSSRRLVRIPGPYESSVKSPGHEGAALSVAFSPDGKSLISGADDRTARVWNIRDGEESWQGRKGLQRLVESQIRLEGCPGAVTSVTVSPDNTLVGTGCSDGAIRLYPLSEVRNPQSDSSAWQPIAELFGHTGEIRQIRFDATLRMLISSSSDRTIRVWRIPRVNDLRNLQEISSRVGLLSSAGDLAGLKSLVPETRRMARSGSLKDKWQYDGTSN